MLVLACLDPPPHDCNCRLSSQLCAAISVTDLKWRNQSGLFDVCPVKFVLLEDKFLLNISICSFLDISYVIIRFMRLGTMLTYLYLTWQNINVSKYSFSELHFTLIKYYVTIILQQHNHPVKYGWELLLGPDKIVVKGPETCWWFYSSLSCRNSSLSAL